MSWYARKWWRFALAYTNSVEITDAEGRWVCVAGPVWLLIERHETSVEKTR